MNATAADLIERVLPPQTGLPQWMLTFPFSWRRRLAQDGALLGRAHAHLRGDGAGLLRRPHGAKTGALTAVQRTSSDLRLNPHLHVVVLDGAYYVDPEEAGAEGASRCA